MLSLFICSFLLLNIIIWKGLYILKYKNLCKLHSSNNILLVIINFLYPANHAILKLNKAVIIEVMWTLVTYTSFISVDINLERIFFPKTHNLGQIHNSSDLNSVLLKCLYQAIDDFIILVWVIMVIDEVLWILYTHYYFVIENINFEI